MPALVKLITGKGNHSVGNQPVLLPAVKKHLDALDMHYIEAAGCLMVGIRHVDNKAVAHYNVCTGGPKNFYASALR